jgi:serine protease Do
MLMAMLLVASQAIATEREIPASHQQLMLSYAPLVKKAAPAVVNIYTNRKIKEISPLMGDPFFRQFFGGNLVREREVSSLGSGVIVDSAGLVMTNNHVVKNSDEIKVVLSDRREYEAEIILADPTTDLALLKLKNVTGELPKLELADSDGIEVGDIVLAIGNPFGVGQTVTSGIVSALARTTVGITDYQFFIQTDAAINPGNSGGALLDMNGKLLGINTAIYSRTGSSNGIGFAIPSNMVATVLHNQKGGKVVRPWFGAALQPVTQDVADSIGLDTPRGALVKDTYPGSPAARAGLKKGDVILAFDGKETPDAQSLKFRIATSPLHHEATLNILRNGKRESLSLSLEAPPETPARDLTRIEGRSPLSGAVVANLSPALASEIGFHEYSGVVILKIVPQSKAGIIGFAQQDIILAVNNQKIASVNQLKTALSKPVRNWIISFKRGDKVVEVTLAR